METHDEHRRRMIIEVLNEANKSVETLRERINAALLAANGSFTGEDRLDDLVLADLLASMRKSIGNYSMMSLAFLILETMFEKEEAL